LLEQYPLIPKSLNLTPAEGNCTLTRSTKVLVYPNTKETRELGEFVANFLGKSLGAPIQVKAGEADLVRNALSIVVDAAADSRPEGYALLVTPQGILIKASTVTGAFWGFQTVRQLMPAVVEKQLPLVGTYLDIPCVEITDEPRFTYRGLHLDVSRHMFPVAFIKKYIDTMAAYKFNTLHWHLTDDQGWRLEIKKYPKLQEIAAYRDETLVGHKNSFPHVYDGTRYGGYYTQDEVKEIIEYARLRHITIIPEIELPGHCIAALAAYPELGCTGGPYKTGREWGIYDDVYCAGNEKTFSFLQDVLDEVINLFPSTYIHIGGDEVPKTRWKACPQCQERIKELGLRDEHELQSYCIQRVEKYLNSKGRHIIGWDEILEGGLAPHATVMSWRGEQGGIAAAQQGHDVIMTPCTNVYFDHYQSKSPYEPLAIGGYAPLDVVYGYEPIPSELDEDQAQHILGAQANVWTEYIPTQEYVEYMTYPRAIALAEVIWSAKQVKNYEDFVIRLKHNLLHLKSMNVHYADCSVST
ncbi:MAG: beta-N-acetylhexosaminidase, partial [Candidatus Babeliales bacterium]